jgi:glycosyltransferase involved in cell wall biosynthesis
MKVITRPLGVLVLSQTYPPDVGGVETHLSDLTAAFTKHPDWRVWMVTYKPIVTDVNTYHSFEQQGNVTIRRFWWFGGNLFRKLEPCPPLMFLYIVPYFMCRLFFYILPRMKEIDVIHVHGINMAVVGWVFGSLFHKRVVFQSHALYAFKQGSAFAKVVAFLLKRMNAILALCMASKEEFITLGVPAERISVYRYWIDLKRFTANERTPNDVFTAFFVGRLIGIKGEDWVIELAKRFPDILFKIAGGGPNEKKVIAAAKQIANLDYLGLIPNNQLHNYYRTADVLLVPSQYPEGFGRVICEALACGTPVIASNIGGIPDAMDNTVGVLCDLDIENFVAALLQMSEDRAWHRALKANARLFAERQFSDRNAEAIMQSVEGENV